MEPLVATGRRMAVAVIARISLPMIVAVGIVVLVSGTVFAAAPFSNGTRWANSDVCYRVDPTAASFALEIDQAAAAWTNASQHGFRLVRDYTGLCPNYVAEGWIDGYKGWYGMTIIHTNYGDFGCQPGWPLGCIDPPPNSVITGAYTVLESFTCAEDDPTCICGGTLITHGSKQILTFNDPIGCGPVPYPPGYCGAAVIPNTVMLPAPYGLRWDTPGAYETALHEFGHWLWFKDAFIVSVPARVSAMEWLNPQGCADALGVGPDFYTLYPDDVYALNELYN